MSAVPDTLKVTRPGTRKMRQRTLCLGGSRVPSRDGLPFASCLDAYPTRSLRSREKPSQDSQGRIKHMRYLSTLVPKPRPNRVGSQSQGRIEHVRSHSSK